MNHPAYRHYGGKGVSMDARWKKSFKAFLADMGPCPEGMSLDRLDSNGNYCLENCRWATKQEQMRNTSYSLCLPEWDNKNIRDLLEEHYGRFSMTDYHRVTARLKAGWDPVTALYVPAGELASKYSDPRLVGSVMLHEKLKTLGIISSLMEKTSERKSNGTYSLMEVSHNGQVATLSEWCKRLGINYRTAVRRFKKGWSVDKILCINPVRGFRVTFEGKDYNLRQLAELLEMDYRMLQKRIEFCKGDVEKAASIGVQPKGFKFKEALEQCCS